MPEPRDLGTGALLASASLAISYVAIGITSIAAARIVGPNGTGVVALSNQIVQTPASPGVQQRPLRPSRS